MEDLTKLLNDNNIPMDVNRVKTFTDRWGQIISASYTHKGCVYKVEGLPFTPRGGSLMQTIYTSTITCKGITTYDSFIEMFKNNSS